MGKKTSPHTKLLINCSHSKFKISNCFLQNDKIERMIESLPCLKLWFLS